MILDFKREEGSRVAIPIHYILSIHEYTKTTTVIDTRESNYEVVGTYEEILKQYQDEIYWHKQMLPTLLNL